MSKKAGQLVLSFFISMFLLVCLSSAKNVYLNCSVSTTCQYPNVNVLSISDLSDAHAELNSQSNYPYHVCCSPVNTTISVSQEISGGFIGLSYPTDAHAEIGTQN